MCVSLFEKTYCVFYSFVTDGSTLIYLFYGFMSGRSTVTNLLEFSNYSISVLESDEPQDVIHTDIRKTFDRLNHSILLN